MRNNNKTSIPNSWEIINLGFISEKPQYGWTTKANHNEGYVRLLRTSDITGGYINWEDVPFCTEIPSDLGKYQLHYNDIVISRAGSIGVSQLIKNCPLAVFASYLIRFKIVSVIDSNFIHYFFKSPGYWTQIHEEKSGIALPNINANKLSKILLPIAPFNEQKRIVAELDKQFSRLDKAVEALEEAKKKLERYRASVLKAACEGRLVETEAECARREGREYEPADKLLNRLLEERRTRWIEDQMKNWEEKKKKAGWSREKIKKESSKQKDLLTKKYKPPTPPDTSELPELPEGWCWATLDIISDVTKLAGFEYTKYVTYDSGGDLAVIKAENAGKDGFKFTDFSMVHYNTVKHLKRSWLHGGELLMVFVGAGIGQVAIVPHDRKYFLGPNIAVIRIRSDNVISRFVEIFLRSSIGFNITMSYVKAVAQPSLSMSNIRKIAVPIPPLCEQKKIIDKFNKNHEYIRRYSNQINEMITKSSNLRKSFLQFAFEGKLVPQDPDDEPACVLLERIKLEKKEHKEVEKGKRKRGIRMKSQKISKKERRSLVETLKDLGKPVSPETLLTESGYDADSIEDFYLELKKVIKIEIIEERPAFDKVLLRLEK